MHPIIEDILDVVFNVDWRYRRRNRTDYANPSARPGLEAGETGGYLWDKHAKSWIYDPEATKEDTLKYVPGGY